MPTLVDQLIEEKILRTPTIIEAFRRMPRRHFLPDEEQVNDELNVPLPIGRGQTNSQPLTVAFMLELLQPQAGDRVLDIGSGSGWTAALLSTIVGPQGQVYGIERIEELVEFGQANIDKLGLSNVSLRHGDGATGDSDHGPFQRIHVAAAAAEVPEDLKNQLAVGGRLVIPVGIGRQFVALLERVGPSEFHQKEYPGFSFVPLLAGSVA